MASRVNNTGRIRLTAVLALCLAPLCQAEIRVTDDLGRELLLEKPAQRIVSLAPHNTENLYSAGAGDQVVGTVDHSDYPKPALDIPRVGNYKQINIEAILALQPDLVIAWSSGNRNGTTQRLIDLGLPVFISEPNSFELIISNIERFSRMAGRHAEVAADIEKMRETYRDLEAEYSKKSPVRVFYQVWNPPLMTLSREHSVNGALELCGGINVFADEPGLAPRINVEGVIAKNPQLILLAGHSQAQSPAWEEAWQQWPAIDAVANGQVKLINPDIINRPTRRFLEGTRELCELIDAARQVMQGKPAKRQ